MTCGWSFEDFLSRARAARERLGGSAEPESGRVVFFRLSSADVAALRGLARLHGLRPHEVARAVLLAFLHRRGPEA